MKKQSNQFTNTAAKAVFVIGVLIIVSSIIGGCIEGIKKDLNIALIIWGAGFVIGVLFIALAEIIQLLDSIKNKL